MFVSYLLNIDSLISFTQFSPAAYVVRGKVMFSLCLSVHAGEEVPQITGPWSLVPVLSWGRGVPWYLVLGPVLAKAEVEGVPPSWSGCAGGGGGEEHRIRSLDSGIAPRRTRHGQDTARAACLWHYQAGRLSCLLDKLSYWNDFLKKEYCYSRYWSLSRFHWLYCHQMGNYWIYKEHGGWSKIIYYYQNIKTESNFSQLKGETKKYFNLWSTFVFIILFWDQGAHV